jgi:hypothetical protein
MYLAYFDESGDSGTVNSPTKFFVLSCVLVHESKWLDILDHLIRLRGILRRRFHIPTRPEIKAIHLRKGRGPLTHLRWSTEQRMELFRRVQKYQAEKLEVQTFAIAIDKVRAAERGKEPRETAWTYAVQRLNKFSGESEHAMIFPDEGHGFFIRKLVRRMRRFHRVPRHWGSGLIEFPTNRIVEDPNDRKSHDSYFVQLADWNAFAAHRSRYVDPQPAVSPMLWDELTPIHLAEVNSVRGGPPGLVIYPWPETNAAPE